MVRTSTKLHAVASMVVIFSFLLTACGGSGADTPNPVPATKSPTARPNPQPRQGWDPEVLMSIIEDASILKPLKPHDDVAKEEKEEGDYKIITEKHDVLKNMESVLYLGQNDDLLFPGAIIQGEGVYDFVYTPIITARAPVTLSLPLEGVPTTGESIQIAIKDPSRLSNVRQGINNLLKSAIQPATRVPAKFDYTYQQVYSRSEKNLALGVSASYADASMKYDFNWNSEQQRNKILSVYKQVYYTVDVDLPQAPYDFFDPAAGMDAVAAALPRGSMPMFVSSVSYGWLAVLFIETDYSMEQMGMALDAAYDPAGDLEAKLSFGYSAKDVLQNSKIQIIVYGGSTSGITSNTLKGYSGLLELIQGSKDFGASSPAVPISYRLRHLANYQLAQIALTENYTLTKKVPLRQFINISAEKFSCIWDNDGSGPLDMDRFFFFVKVYQGDKLIADQQILNWQNPHWTNMRAGDVWKPDKKASTVILLDLKNFDPSAYRVVLTASARDYDDFGPNDWSSGGDTLSGDAMLAKPENFFTITDAADMTFQVSYSIIPSTEAECNTYPACQQQLAAWGGTPAATPKP